MFGKIPGNIYQKLLKNSDIGYFVIFNVEYPEHLHLLKKNYNFYQKRLKQQQQQPKKLVYNFYDEKIILQTSFIWMKVVLRVIKLKN